jgi:hypothetical protein
MAAHKGPASSRPRFTLSGSSVDAMPVYCLSGIQRSFDNVSTLLEKKLCSQTKLIFVSRPCWRWNLFVCLFVSIASTKVC